MLQCICKKKISCINCSLQFKFRKQTSLKHAFPLFRHSDRVCNQSVDWILIYSENNHFLERQTDGRRDRRTDGQTSRKTTVNIFFEERKKILKSDQNI